MSSLDTKVEMMSEQMKSQHDDLWRKVEKLETDSVASIRREADALAEGRRHWARYWSNIVVTTVVAVITSVVAFLFTGRK